MTRRSGKIDKKKKTDDIKRGRLFAVRSQTRLRPCLHEQIKPSLVAQILDPYEVTPDEFAQIKRVVFAHVNAP